MWFAGYLEILFHFYSRTFERKLAADLDTMQQISHMVQRAILKFLQSFFILLVELSKEKLLLISHNATNTPYGLAVRIPGFHPGGPSSTPGMGMNFNFALLLKIEYMWFAGYFQILFLLLVEPSKENFLLISIQCNKYPIWSSG